MQNQDKSDIELNKSPELSGAISANSNAIYLQNALSWCNNGCRLFFDLSPVAMSLTSIEGRCISVNPAFERLFGFTEKEMRQKYASDLYHSADNSKRVLEVLEQEGKIRSFEVLMRRRDGEARKIFLDVDWATLNGARLIFTSFQDLTEQRLTEEKLKLQARILDATPASITVQNWQGRFLFANEMTFKLHGYSREEFFAMSLNQLDTPASARLIKPRMREIAEKDAVRFEVEHFRKDRSVFPLEVYCRRVAWLGEDAMLSIAIDITERKKYEQTLREAHDAADAANRAKTFFLANMSHEIRTPMNAIIGFAELAKAEACTPAQRQYLEIVSARSEDLLVLINDILDLSRIESERLELKPEPFNISTMMDAVAQMFMPAAKNKGLELRVELDNRLSHEVYGDVRRLRQILVNLVGNAIKYTQRGSVSLSVKPAVSDRPLPDKLAVHFVVADTGIGIPREQLEIIFTPFTQLSNIHGAGLGGTGLGLSICRGLARIMNGRIWCESKPDKGSAFHFVVQLDRRSVAHDEIIPKTRAVKQLERFYRILVVDDDEDSSKLAVEFLRRQGHAPTAAYSGREALQCLANADYDLVLMDIKMPGIGGFEATRRIRDANSQVRNHAIPIVALTAFAMRDDEQKCLKAGMNGYLSKPITLAALQDVISRVMP